MTVSRRARSDEAPRPPRRARRLALLAGAVLGAALASPAAAEPGPFGGLVAFGDSLSDNGNDAIGLGLPQRQRFTTNPGLVPVELIARRYGLALEPSLAGGTDNAFGGAGVLRNWPPNAPVPTLPAQVGGYLSAHPQADRNALYSVWAGSNDVLYHMNALRAGPGAPPPETAGQAGAEIAAAAQAEGDLIERLQAAGARRIVVFNLPDIGLTPDGAPEGTVLAQTYNGVLSSRLAGRGGVVPVDTFGLLREVAADPRAFGFADATARACTTSSSLLCTPQTLVRPDAPSTFVFADGVHPTTAAYAALADAVIAELDAPGQMSLLAETPLSVMRGHRAAVRAELAQAAGGRGWSLFLGGRAGASRRDGDAFVAAAGGDEQAITGGAIWRSGEGLLLGFAVTGGQSRTKLEGGRGGFDTDTLVGSAFVQREWRNGGWASLQAGLGRSDYGDVERSFPIGAAVRTERASGKGGDSSVELAAGYRARLGGLRAGPFAAYSFDHVHVKGLAEGGGDSTAMWFAPQTRDASVLRVGWSLEGDARLAGVALRPAVTLAYGHDFAAERRDVAAGLVTFDGQFDMPGYLPSRNWGEATVGLEADVAAGVRARLSYEGRFGDRGRENLGALAVAYSF